ncbi:aerobactin siderophore biosynthesis protein iucB [Phakopsora pachyrhizi]|nr:aerobactin siderophore biosynthesis protein iucB [Phakopsora pachyrhizi]KAI8450274.1 aerobactin siderophore biosynthesis protein iucB [Phakopsora pachyrhizi]
MNDYDLVDGSRFPRLRPPTFARPPALLSNVIINLENVQNEEADEGVDHDVRWRIMSFKLLLRGLDPKSVTDSNSLAYTIWYALWDIFGSSQIDGESSKIFVSFTSLMLPDQILDDLLKELLLLVEPKSCLDPIQLSKPWWYQRYPIFCHPNLTQTLDGSERLLEVDQSIASSYPLSLFDGTITSSPSPSSKFLNDRRTTQKDLPNSPETIYERYFDHLQGYLCLSIYGNTYNDIMNLHNWLNDPRVDEFWKDSGSLDFHVKWLKERHEDRFSLPILGSYRGTNGADKTVIEPFSYFEIYWASEANISKVYQTEPYDRGIHMLVGSSSHRGPHRVRSWLPSLVHYIFSSEPRTCRILSEPNHKNLKMINYLESFGFIKVTEADMGHKIAAIMVLERDDFWKNCPL